MKKIKIETSFKDDRGTITDLLENEQIDAITRISFNSGAVRANHYHKQTFQWNYLLEGEIMLVTRLPDEAVEQTIMTAGDLYVTVPLEEHALKCLSDTADLLVFTRGPRAGKEYKSDTFTLEVPLI